jgi:molybdopterin-guanine dinucleotide biosynthesis protein A
MPSVSAAILAGGHAERFGGRDKSSLVIEGRTILERQVAELRELTTEIWLVGRLASACPSVTPLPDLEADRGPLGGLQAALSAATGAAVVVLACDMPFVSSAFLAYLVAKTAGVDAVVPKTEHGYHPLCAVYTRGAIEPIARRLAAGHLKMTELIADLRLRVVGTEEIEQFGSRHRLLANVNTPREYADLVTPHTQET